MYWERKDCHNVLASTLMTKNEFKECKKYLHIADNDNLDPEVRLAKVHLFLMKLSQSIKQSLKEFWKIEKFQNRGVPQDIQINL